MAIETSNPEAISKCKALAAFVDRHTHGKGNGPHATKINQLEFLREEACTAMQGCTEPILAVVVQGKKEVWLNEETYEYGVAQYLVVSVDLPLNGFAIGATSAQPYLGIKLTLDPVQLCDIIAQTNPDRGEKENSVRGWFISNANRSLIDCALRLTQLLDTPEDIPFIAPMIIPKNIFGLFS